MNKNIEYYMSLPYTVEYEYVTDDPNYPEGYYFGKIVELDGCHMDAETITELLAELEIVKRLYLEIRLIPHKKPHNPFLSSYRNQLNQIEGDKDKRPNKASVAPYRCFVG